MAGKGTEIWTEVRQVLWAPRGVSQDLARRRSQGTCQRASCVIQDKALNLSGLVEDKGGCQFFATTH